MSVATLEEASKVFTKYKKTFENYLESTLDRFEFKGNDLEKACHYALTCGGKRFRPILVLLLANSCGGGFSLDAALCVELFHTASLLIDDLPCMDDDDVRRGKPSTHSVFGEGVAILSNYSMIAEAFDCVRRNVEHSRAENHPFVESCDLASAALKCICKNLGSRGIAGGQFLDLYGKDVSEEGVTEALKLKTATLFDMSFVLGWIFGGGKPELIPQVEKLALHFGLAFQIADDIDDYEKDKELGKEMNLAIALGKEEAHKEFQKHIEQAKKCIEDLPVDPKELTLLCDYLSIKGNS